MATTDYDALAALYYATDGANWKQNRNWITDTDLSQWYGVELNDQGRVARLNLYSNNLRGVIPNELEALAKLEQLVLAYNQLRGPIPEVLGNLSELRELWLSSNHLSGSVPEALGALKELRGLWASNNQLSDIPRATAEKFNAMPRLGVDLKDNPWETPPWSVIQGGWDQVVSFHEALSQSGGQVVPSLKVVLVGAVGAGKTTLARGLLDGKVAQTVPPRTRGVDIEPWVPDFDPPLEVLIWDFAGHDDYHSTHQLFLTDGALHLLVVDLHKFDRDFLSRGGGVYIWLDSLLCRVPGSAILVVATHADAFGDDHERSAGALEVLKAMITEHLETKRQDWLAAKRQEERELMSSSRPASTGRNFMAESRADRSKPAPPSLHLCGFISVSGRSLDDLLTLGEVIWEVANEPAVFPSVRKIVPGIWRRVWAVMDALHVGADPDSAVRLEGPVVAIEGRDKHEFVTQEQAFEVWSRADRESAAELEAAGHFGEQLRLASSQQFQAALNLRQMGGAVLAACGLIHLNPSWINVLLRELSDHRWTDPDEEEWWWKQLKAYEQNRGIPIDELLDTHRRFTTTGMVTEDFLRLLWRDLVKGIDEKVFARLVETMTAHDAMFPCNDGVTEGNAREFMVPARLPDGVTSDSLAKLEKLEDAMSRGTRMQFVIKIYAKYVPPGIIAKFLGGFGRDESGLFRNMMFRTCWARGVAFVAGGRECLVRLGEDSTRPLHMIEINIAGPDANNVFEVGFEIKKYVKKILREAYPGLAFDSSANPRFMDGTEAWQDSLEALQRDLFEKLDQSLESVLSEILESFKVQSLSVNEGIARRLDRLCLDCQRDTSFQLDSKAHEVVTRVEKVVRASLRTSLSTTAVPKGGLSETERGILNSLARNVAFLLWPIPSLMCVLPARENRAKPLDEKDRSFEEWSTFLQKWCSEGKKMGRGVATRKLRLFFLCPLDMSLAECGPDGQGYQVTELLSWAEKAKPWAEFGLALASIAVNVCTGLAIPAADIEAVFGTNAGGALSEFVNEALTSSTEAMATNAGEIIEDGNTAERIHHAGACRLGRQKVRRPTPLQGVAYNQLKEVFKSFDVDGTQKGKPPVPRFDEAMQLVDRGGRGVEWAWVRKQNVDQYVSL